MFVLTVLVNTVSAINIYSGDKTRYLQSYFGKNATKVINPMLHTIRNDIDMFIKDFDKLINGFGITI